MTSAAVCQHSSFRQSVKQLHLKPVLSKLSVERFSKSVVPWTFRLNKQSPHAKLIQPVPNTSCRKLRTIIRTNVLGCTTCHQQGTESFQHIFTGSVDGNRRYHVASQHRGLESYPGLASILIHYRPNRDICISPGRVTRLICFTARNPFDDVIHLVRLIYS